MNKVINEMMSNCKVDVSSSEVKKSNFIKPIGSEWHANQYNDNKNMNVILSLLSTQSMKPCDLKELYELYHAKIENYFELVKTPFNTRRAMLFNLLEDQVLQDVIERNNQGQLLIYEEKEKPEVILEQKVEKLAELVPSAFKYTLLQARGLTKFDNYGAYAKLLWKNHKKILKEIQSELSKEIFNRKKDQYKYNMNGKTYVIEKLICYKCNKRDHKASYCSEKTVNNIKKTIVTAYRGYYKNN
uniref:PRE_C2HC domain-containing protein n=1 Tax=Strongyloides venezuelensis TaxID=75913 RepID=A0A0K0FDR0_STRVS